MVVSYVVSGGCRPVRRYLDLPLCPIATAEHGIGYNIISVCLPYCLSPIIRSLFLLQFDVTLYHHYDFSTEGFIFATCTTVSH